MVALWILGILLLLIILLLLLRVGVRIRFGDELCVTATAGPIRLQLVPKPEKEKKERAVSCLHRVDLMDAEELYPSEISGGMKKRVAIARAIVLEPKFLFCDEPNSGLDPLTSIVIDNLIYEITHEYNMTTVINTHDMNSVFEIGEKIVFIHDGKKEWEGNKDQIAHSDNTYLNDFIFSSKLYKKIKSSL